MRNATPVSRQPVAKALQHEAIALVGLPPGVFRAPIFDLTPKCRPIHGSIVGTRVDFAGAIALAAESKVRTSTCVEHLERVTAEPSRLGQGKGDGRVLKRA